MCVCLRARSVLLFLSYYFSLSLSVAFQNVQKWINHLQKTTTARNNFELNDVRISELKFTWTLWHNVRNVFNNVRKWKNNNNKTKIQKKRAKAFSTVLFSTHMANQWWDESVDFSPLMPLLCRLLIFVYLFLRVLFFPLFLYRVCAPYCSIFISIKLMIFFFLGHIASHPHVHLFDTKRFL